MRIEDNFTLAAPAERVYGALLAADVLARTLPGCERLIQLGPAGEDSGVRFEARLRSKESICIVSLHLRGGRQHNRVEITLHTLGTDVAYTGRGAITLVRHGGQTLLSYSLALEALAGAETALDEAALQALARACGGRFAAALAEPAASSAELAPASDVALEIPRIQIGQLGQRAVWMGGGLLVGVVALALVTTLARLLAERE